MSIRVVGLMSVKSVSPLTTLVHDAIRRRFSAYLWAARFHSAGCQVVTIDITVEKRDCGKRDWLVLRWWLPTILCSFCSVPVFRSVPFLVPSLRYVPFIVSFVHCVRCLVYLFSVSEEYHGGSIYSSVSQYRYLTRYRSNMP